MATVWRSQSAFARLLARKTPNILNNATDSSAQNILEPLQILSRTYSNYAHSPFVTKIKEQYEYEIVKKPPEWEFVKNLLPLNTIPKVTQKDNYPSGWIPPKEEAQTLPYFIQRTKHHELPIYLDVTFRGQRRISLIKKIDGDIWLLNDELKAYLKEKTGSEVTTRVHELGRFIETKGDFVNHIINWAHSKGF